MPAVIPVALGALAVSAVSSIVGGGIIGAVIGGVVGSAVLSFTAPIFGSKPKQDRFAAPTVTSISTASRGRMEMVNQPITTHRVIYGRSRVSGPLVFTHSRPISASDTKLDMLHWVIVLAAHEVDAIEAVLFNDEVMALDNNGDATDVPYYRDSTVYAHVDRHLGTADQTANARLITHSHGQWTSAHRLRGLAYLHAEMRYDERAYPSGVPNISAIVRGRKLYDPRTSTSLWSDNAALCILDYLIADFGLGATLDDIDQPAFIAAANICDELVDTLDGTEKRYTCNGVADLGDTPRDILEALLSSCAGSLTYTGGKWRLHVGAFVPPIKTFDERYLRDTVTMRPHRSRRQLFNTIKGAFISPDHNWQATDYPAIKSDSYIAQDYGEEILSTLDLSFTTSVTMAQRIAKIALEQTRRQRQIQYPANLAGFQVAAGSTVAVDLARFGVNGLPCRVVNWQMTEDMGIDLTLAEDGADIYAFHPSDLRPMGSAPQIVVPNNQAIPPRVPQNVSASADHNSITVSWDPITESDFRYVEVWENTSDTPNPAQGTARILEVYDNSFTRNLLPGSETRYYWLRAVDRTGNRSEFAGPVTATTTGSQTVVLVLE